MEALVNKAVDTLKKGKLIVFPTDTIWGIGVDARNATAVAQVYALKQRPTSKAMICLVADATMLLEYLENKKPLPNSLFEEERPTSIVFSNPKGLAKNLVAADNTIAFRIPKDEFCQQVIKGLGGPVVATSANMSQDPTPQQFSEINPAILKGVDYVVPLKQDEIRTQPSRVLKVDAAGTVHVLRH
jgi:L-threonylcarbamoyladenylate synthase